MHNIGLRYYEEVKDAFPFLFRSNSIPIIEINSCFFQDQLHVFMTVSGSQNRLTCHILFLNVGFESFHFLIRRLYYCFSWRFNFWFSFLGQICFLNRDSKRFDFISQNLLMLLNVKSLFTGCIIIRHHY